MIRFSPCTFVNTSATERSHANIFMAVMYHLIHGEYKPLGFLFPSDMKLITIVFVSLHSNTDVDHPDFAPHYCRGSYPVMEVEVANW